MYNQEKDKLIKMFEKTNENGATLLISIFSYDGGAKKLAMTRSYVKKDGTVGYSNSGRLSYDEVEFLKSILDEILTEMKS